MSLSPLEIQQLADAIAERLAICATGDVYLDALGAAALLSCSVPTVERLTRLGVIPSKTFGRLRRYLRSALLALANEKGGHDHDE